MAHPAPSEPRADHRCTSTRYFELVAEGVLAADERVELLEGVIVGMSPQNPRHAAGVHLAMRALSVAVGARAFVRSQSPLVVSAHSVPEPDVAVVPGSLPDYFDRHPTSALLVVEVADSSLMQDRLTKAPIYAAAGVPEYWLVNLRDDRVEVFRAPDPTARRYATVKHVQRGERLELVALPGIGVDAGDLLPAPAAS